MRLPPYPKYKPSDVEWLGDVPAHWGVKPLGRLGRFTGGATPDKGKPEYWDGDIPWVSPKDMKRMRIDDVPDHVSTEGLSSSALTLMPAQSVLIVVRGMILAHSFPVAIADAPVTINQDMKALTSGKRLNAEFLLWLLTGIARVFVSLAEESAHGTRKLEIGVVARVCVALPPTNEQISIIDFLDRETAKIDTLVAKQRTLIDRLKEKRTALISRTVARGLPPDAARATGLDPHPKLKPTGIDWIGEVPEHWELGKFSREVRIAGGQVDPEVEPYCSMILVAPNHIESRTGRLLAQETATDQAAISGKYLCRSGEVIYSKIRPALAKVVLAPEDCLCSADMYPMTSRGRLRNRYLLLLLLSSQFTALSVLEAERVAMPKLNRETLGDLRMPVPPSREQEATADFLEYETAKIDALVAKIETAIKRFQEYRTALITAAVTGKIDVRGTVAPREDAA